MRKDFVYTSGSSVGKFFMLDTMVTLPFPRLDVSTLLYMDTQFSAMYDCFITLQNGALSTCSLAAAVKSL